MFPRHSTFCLRGEGSRAALVAVGSVFSALDSVGEGRPLNCWKCGDCRIGQRDDHLAVPRF